MTYGTCLEPSVLSRGVGVGDPVQGWRWFPALGGPEDRPKPEGPPAPNTKVPDKHLP